MQTTVQGPTDSKESKCFFYINNPPRHGKSLLLDQLFAGDHGLLEQPHVCVLSLTYNAATGIHPEELATVEGALMGFFIRVIDSLAVQALGGIDDLLKDNPFAATAEPIWPQICNAPDKFFRWLIGIPMTHSDPPPPGNVLLCIDEVSKLLDHKDNKWHANAAQQKQFWKTLFSIQRAVEPGWIRIVMTGFTDTPKAGIDSSDVGCERMSLSMITSAEQEVLAAELIWAYAVHNQCFPGLTWQVTKSTPGLLGTWAQIIRLRVLQDRGAVGRCDPALVNSATFFKPPSAGSSVRVPWVTRLQETAGDNWHIIRQFLVESVRSCGISTATARLARNHELATEIAYDDIRTQVVLSPFAVVVTVKVIQAEARSASDPVGSLLLNIMLEIFKACDDHAAGCVKNHTDPKWRQKVLQKLRIEFANENSPLRQSPILSKDDRVTGLAPIASDQISAFKSGACVERMGEPFERFTRWAVALRLSASLQTGDTGAAIATVLASDILPQFFGRVNRAAFDDDVAVEVAFVVNVNREQAALFTSTAALMLPSSVDMILDRPTTCEIQRDCLSDIREQGYDLKATFQYDGVLVEDDSRTPFSFPMLSVEPTEPGNPVHRNLLNFVTEALDKGLRIDEAAAREYVRREQDKNPALAQHLKAGRVLRTYDDVSRVVALVHQSSSQRKAIVWNPSNPCNPGADNVVIIPTRVDRNVVMLFIENNDTKSNEKINKQLRLWTSNVLLLPAIKQVADASGITVRFACLFIGRVPCW